MTAVKARLVSILWSLRGYLSLLAARERGVYTALFRHRVVAAGMKGVAPQKPADGEPKSLPDAMATDRLKGVLRTGWMESAAWWKQRRKKTLVGENQTDKKRLHGVSIELTG